MTRQTHQGVAARPKVGQGSLRRIQDIPPYCCGSTWGNTRGMSLAVMEQASHLKCGKLRKM